MQELKVFSNSEFGEVRTTEIDGVVWFVGKDIADKLGYANQSKALLDHVDEEDKLNNDSLSSLGQRGGWLINESGLYSLVLSSKLPSAKKFKRWITSDVLPTIRKTGGYVNNEDLFVNTYLSSADEQTKLLFKTTLETVRNLNAKIQQQKPLVEFAETVSKAANSISIGDFAKILNSEHIKLGRNKMFEWFRSNKYLMRNNTPYQKYIDQGYFKVIEQVYTTPYGNETKTKTLVTGKGQIYFVETLRKLF